MRGTTDEYNYFLPFQSKDEQLKGLGKGDKNGSDNEKCLFFQYSFLMNNNEQAFGQLWILFTLLCKRAVRKEMKTKRFFLDYDEVQYKADIAAEYVLRRYKSFLREKGEYYVIKNFIAAAHDGVVHALYSEGENDFYLSVCKELNDKPVAEVKRRGVKLNKIMDCSREEKQEDFDEDIREGQLLMF